MKLLISYLLLLLSLHVLYAQIIEEMDLPLIGESTDSSASSNKSQCVPPCRKGFFCNDGQCISKCNPPCPDGMDCWDDGECHPYSSTVKKTLNAMHQITRVLSKDELVQGAEIKINKKNARVKILDTTFICDKEIYLNVPYGEYEIYVDAPGYFVNEEDLEVKLGTVETIEVKLRPYQICAGMVLGTSSMKEFSMLAGEINIGLGISSLIYAGLTATYVGPFDGKTTNVTNYKYAYIPDTLKEVWTELAGFGVSCGYIGINPFAGRIKLIPHIGLGYWKYDDQTYFLQKYQSGKTKYLDDLERHNIEKYFVRPTLEVRVGERAFNLDCRISALFGTGVPIVTLLTGFQVAVPR